MKSARLDLEALEFFIKVVDAKSFAAVTRALNVPKATLSRKLRHLEEQLGVQLLVRNTRTLSATKEGLETYIAGKSLLEASDHLITKLSDQNLTPSGTLRITVGVEFGVTILTPIIAKFCKAYPSLSIDLDLSGRAVDLVHENKDVAIRIGPLKDSSLMARPLGQFQYGLYASPQLLKAHLIKDVNHLETAPALVFRSISHDQQWKLVSGNLVRSVRVTPKLVCNNHWLLLRAAEQGMGIVFSPQFLAEQSVNDKRLARILPKWESPPISINAIFVKREFPDQKIRLFLDFVANNIKEGIRGQMLSS